MNMIFIYWKLSLFCDFRSCILYQISIVIMKNIKFGKYFQNICRSPGEWVLKNDQWFSKKNLDEGEKSDKIEKNNFSQNLDDYHFGPVANRIPLTISYKNQWKIEKNRVQGKKPCTFFRYLQSHFSRNSPLIVQFDWFNIYS